ncbi:plasmalemma vesicle associated protein b isoform X2 [Latimeria chalumnae]|uniref:plasmalemma vesicle associated protein b isoform X2 n=1 Tax=Latimeria chalumnae TaxID=7897 RepID=UPI0003C18F0E|nr:PREDICTED: plasmalemma vesicle-associated protein isoform X2 [Latimeria chalumnae]|eukprot:XP_006001676.1 PREDICTED: plasmalemma vesicle-associated protein isoform X2 [Latimeria chalumnae]
MYNHRYAMAKFGLQSKDIQKPKEKGCGFYLKYFFCFASLIQFLIILGLVLFMVYGNTQTSTDHRIENLEQKASNMNIKIKELKNQNHNLTIELNATRTQRNYLNWKLEHTNKALQEVNSTAIFYAAYIRDVAGKLDRIKKAVDSASDCNMKINANTLQLHMDLSRCKTDLETTRKQLITTNATYAILSTSFQQKQSESDQCRLKQFELNQQKGDLISQMDSFKQKCSNISEYFNTTVSTLKAEMQKSSLFIRNPTTGSNSLQLYNFLNDSFLSRFARMEENIKNEALKNSRLGVEKESYRKRYEECNRIRSRMAFDNQNRLSIYEKARDAELSKELVEKQTLRNEKEDLNKQLQEKVRSMNLLSKDLQALNASLARCKNPTGSMDSTFPIVPFPSLGRTSGYSGNIFPGNSDTVLKSLSDMAKQLDEQQKKKGIIS